MNCKEVTNYLKGFAILTVYANHFINSYITNSFKEYANGFICLFFILSGYGIYHSLEKQIDKPFSKFFIFFLKKRLMRIYPLFWIWCILNGFPDGILGFLALNPVNPQTPWFVPAIMQCYIFAPFLYIFTKHIKLRYSFTIIFFLFIFANILLFGVEDIAPERAIAYRSIFFLHIILFYLGYILAQDEHILAKIKKGRPWPTYFTYSSFLLFVFCIHETTPQAALSFPGKEYLFALLMSFFVFCFCFFLLSIEIVLPFKKSMIFIGIHSFSLYLFEGYSKSFLSRIGILDKNNVQLMGVLFWLITLPLFFLIYAALETAVNEFIFGKRNFENAFKTFTMELPFNLKILCQRQKKLKK